jgi:hypothetical protein
MNRKNRKKHTTAGKTTVAPGSVAGFRQPGSAIPTACIHPERP